MSLSEQIQRVDGSQNDILKALAESYGINTDGLKIDQIAAKVKASQKFKLDGLLSTATAGKYGLGSDAAPNDVFDKIKVMLDAVQNPARIVQGSYIGTGEMSKTITIGFKPKLFIISLTTKEDGLGPFSLQHNAVIWIGQSKIHVRNTSDPDGEISVSETGITLTRYLSGNEGSDNLNEPGATYRYVGVG